MDRGDPISYMVLAKGTPVVSSDGVEVGTVKRVLEVPQKDVFDGVVFTTADGERFADADDIGEIYERALVLRVDADGAGRLPRPGENPAVMGVTPDDVVESSTTSALRRLWLRVTGR